MARNSAGLRRSVLRSRKSQAKSNGWRGNWRDRFNIPKAASTYILLTRGSYPNPDDLDEKGEMREAHYHTGLFHAARSGNSFFSNRCAIDAAIAAGGTQDDVECLGCYEQDRGNSSLGKKAKTAYSFNLIHLGLYEQVQEVGQDGRKRFYDRDYGENIKRGDPVMTWTEVLKPKARTNILNNIEKLLADGSVRMMTKKYLEVGSGFRDQLASIEDETSKMCMCGGHLTPIVFVCEKCEEVLAYVEGDPDDKKDEGMSEQEVAEFSSERQRCHECGHQGFPMIEPVCDNCSDPQALTPFDVVVSIRKRGEGTNTTLIFDEIIPLTEFELPNGESLLEWGDDDEPVLDEDGNWEFTEDFSIKKLATNQFDFEKVHTPRDNDWMAMKLGVSNPFPSTRSSAGSKYRKYGTSSSASGASGDADDTASEEAPKRRTRRKRVK
jgi:hypothetical protein